MQDLADACENPKVRVPYPYQAQCVVLVSHPRVKLGGVQNQTREMRDTAMVEKINAFHVSGRLSIRCQSVKECLNARHLLLGFRAASAS